MHIENETAFGDREEQKILLAKEEINVSKKIENEKRVFRKEVIEEEVSIPVELMQEDITVNHVSINREVTEMPGIRTKGDTTIIPVVREEIEIIKKKILVEEIHITKKTSSRQEQINDVIRKEIFKEDQ